MPQHIMHSQNVAGPHEAGAPSDEGHGRANYVRLGVATSVSFVVMFAVMFARVNVADNIFLSLNNAYMAGLMASPMPLIMLATMPMMFRDRRLNRAVIGAAIALSGLFFVLIRTQAGVDDRQFLRSMIPHHAGAILVCGNASLTDAEGRRLCRQIIESQQREIVQMKAMLAR